MPLVFSIIIPVLNEEKFIGQCLGALVQQNLPATGFEVILVDNGCTDRTIEIALKFESLLDLRIIRKAKCDISATRDLGAASARGTFLGFLDADCIAPECWLTRALAHLRSGDGGVIGAFYSVPTHSGWVAKVWYGDQAAMRQGPVTYIPSGSLFIDRNVFSKLGGFDPTLQTSEDFEFCQRVKAAGYQVLAVPELSVLHWGTPQTVASFYRKQRWHGSGVRTIIERNMFNPGFAMTILQTLFVSLCLLLAVIAVPLSLIGGKPLLIAIPLGLLLLSSLAMAFHAAKRRGKWSLVLPLTVLYTAYGVARSVSLLGVNGQRSRPGLTTESPISEAAGHSGTN